MYGFTFDRLMETAEHIARHPDYPGKNLMIQQYLQDARDLQEDGSIDYNQYEKLQFVFERVTVRA